MDCIDIELFGTTPVTARPLVAANDATPVIRAPRRPRRIRRLTAPD